MSDCETDMPVTSCDQSVGEGNDKIVAFRMRETSTRHTHLHSLRWLFRSSPCLFMNPLSQSSAPLRKIEREQLPLWKANLDLDSAGLGC